MILLISTIFGDDKMKYLFEEIEKEYHKLAEERGAIIEQITRIERTEDMYFLFEYASISTIERLINQGERDAENVLQLRKERLSIPMFTCTQNNDFCCGIQ
jgi:NTE family protein